MDKLIIIYIVVSSISSCLVCIGLLTDLKDHSLKDALLTYFPIWFYLFIIIFALPGVISGICIHYSIKFLNWKPFKVDQ